MQCLLHLTVIAVITLLLNPEVVTAQECGSGAWYSGWGLNAQITFQNAQYALNSDVLVAGGTTSASATIFNTIGEASSINAAFLTVYQNGGPNPTFAKKVESVHGHLVVGIKEIRHIPGGTKHIGTFEADASDTTVGIILAFVLDTSNQTLETFIIDLNGVEIQLCTASAQEVAIDAVSESIIGIVADSCNYSATMLSLDITTAPY